MQRVCLLLFHLLLPVVLLAQDAQKEPAAAGSVPDPKVFETHHRGVFGGEAIAYLARAGETYLRDEEGQPAASIFSFAYLKEDVDDPSTRPVTFVWNGGPGSSSIWLHMGSLGPRRAVVPSDARDDGAPPYTIEDNTGTLLDVTDLVFVDPVGTGFSRAIGDHEGKEFWGLYEDAEAVARFIRQWLTQHQRWNAPKYIIGESYGTTRAAAVARLLEEDGATVSLNGLMLVSQALDYTGSTPAPDNLIAYITYLPTMAATAWYHDKVADRPASLEAFLDEVRTFAVTEYAPALLQGSRLDQETRSRVRRQLARYLGLSETYIEQSNLRVMGPRFRKELLRDQGLVVGRSDGRYIGDDVDDTADRPEGDPSSYGIDGAYTALFQHYIAAELGVEMDRAYQVSAGRALAVNWHYSPVPEGSYWEPSYVNTAPDLSRALRRNSHLRVLVASGYYDFATPFFDAEYTLARHGILPDRVEMTYYEAGHMMYLHHPSHERLLSDLRRFVQATGSR